MKNGVLIIMLFFVTVNLFGQTVSGDSLKYYEGKTVTVCEKVADTHVTSSEKKTTYLNFGFGYPNQLFTGVIFESDLPNFSYAPAEYLKGKTICLTGMVKIYKDRPEIIIKSPDQIKVKP